MVDACSPENCRTRDGSVSSNLTLSANQRKEMSEMSHYVIYRNIGQTLPYMPSEFYQLDGHWGEMDTCRVYNGIGPAKNSINSINRYGPAKIMEVKVSPTLVY